MSIEPTIDGTFRRLRSDEEHLYLCHLKRLAPEDLRRRFLRAMSDSALAGHAVRVGDPTYFVCGWFVGGHVRGVVEVATDPDGAEAALSVEAASRNQGVGRTLLGHGMRRTRLIGRPVLRVLTTRDNLPMLRVARAFGARLQDIHGEILGTIAPAPGTIAELVFDATENNARLLAGSIGLIGHGVRSAFAAREPDPA